MLKCRRLNTFVKQMRLLSAWRWMRWMQCQAEHAAASQGGCIGCCQSELPLAFTQQTPTRPRPLGSRRESPRAETAAVASQRQPAINEIHTATLQLKGRIGGNLSVAVWRVLLRWKGSGPRASPPLGLFCLLHLKAPCRAVISAGGGSRLP